MREDIFSARCAGCGWVGDRLKRDTRSPCPECGTYPVRVDGRPLLHPKPFSAAIVPGDRIDAPPFFAGKRIYTSTNPGKDDQIIVSINCPRTRKGRRMTALRFAACLRFNRDLHEGIGVLPRDGNRNNFDPANTIIFPTRRVHEMRTKLGQGFQKECAWCGTEFKSLRKQDEMCSKPCRNKIKVELAKERRRANPKTKKVYSPDEIAARRKASILALAESSSALPFEGNG